jgi:hypothetical protein
MTLQKILIVCILLAIVTVMPVMAELNITHLDDGKTLFKDRSYWILWDAIGNHTVGDQFFVNATTNLPAGTKIIYNFYDPDKQCRTKICNLELSAAGEEVTLDSKDQSGIHSISFLINTSGFYATNDYFFDFSVISPNNSEIASSLHHVQVKTFISLYPGPDENIANLVTKPPTSLLLLAGICGSILILVYVFSLRQRKTAQLRKR